MKNMNGKYKNPKKQRAILIVTDSNKYMHKVLPLQAGLYRFFEKNS